MVELIINQETRPNTIKLLKETFENTPNDGKSTYEILAEDLHGNVRRYYVEASWTVKLEDDKIFIISDHIASVIDLKKETPYKTEWRVI